MKNNQQCVLPKIVLAWMQESQMAQSGDTICCALSGGADSVCLLRCLLALAESQQWHLTAIHVNHQLRGEESERDEIFCRTLCEQLQISLQVISCDVIAYTEQKHCSIETAARICRYAAFDTVSADHIATAHTASDNLETMLHRLMRGSGLRGLSGIPPIRGRYIRPLLTTTRTEVEAYLYMLKQDYVTDSTNETNAYTRNQIRHFLIPQMQRWNPALERTSIGMLHALRSEQDYLQQQAEQCFQRHLQSDGTLSGLETEHPAMQQRCIMQLLEQHGISYDAHRVQELQQLLQTGGRCDLTATDQAVCVNGNLAVRKKGSKMQAPAPKVLQEGVQQLFSGFLVEAIRVDWETKRKIPIVHEKLSKVLLDYDKIKGVILLRGRQYGDHVQFAGHRSVSSVKKLIQKKVPPERRQNLHFLADEDGTVFAEFLGVAARVQPTAETKHLLQIEIRRTTSEEDQVE